MPVRSNFGLELWLGNNPGASDPHSLRLHPLYYAPEAEEYFRMGEIAYMRGKKDEAIAFIRSHLRTTFHLMLTRFGSYWFSIRDRPGSVFSLGSWYLDVYVVADAGLILLAWSGTIAAWITQNSDRFLYLVSIAIFPATFYITHVSVRYRFQIDPVVIVLATFGFQYLAERIGLKNLVQSRRLDRA